LKAEILKSTITWPEMGQQTNQAKRVYLLKDEVKLLIDQLIVLWTV